MAYSFGSANNDKIDCGSTDGVTKSTNRTLAALVSVNSAGTARRVIASYSEASNFEHLFLGFNNSGTNVMEWAFQDQTNDTLYGVCTWTTSFAAGSTHLLICTFDGTNLKIYADQDATAKATVDAHTLSPNTHSSQQFRIGNHAVTAANNRSWDGTIYWLGWWTSVLSADDISRLQNGYRPPYCSVAPTDYWAFVADSNDKTGANNGTVSGASAVMPTNWAGFQRKLRNG